MIQDSQFFDELYDLDVDAMIDECLLPHHLDEEVTRFEEPLGQAVSQIWNTYALPPRKEENCWSKENHPAMTHSIKSMVGDDEVCTTNNLTYAAALIAVGPLLSRIKISWSDVQFSRYMFNYAEGWVLLPPSMDSSFEAVNRYNRGNGVPFVLDTIKFKNLSAVRKQSDMNVDLPSKFRNLSEAASWTDKDWFTYDMHQFALLIGTEIFDFVKAKQFPYLYKWEGGCGASPPWNNLLTAAGAIFRYKRGRARRGILGIMEDVNLLITGNRRPNDCWFARNLNLAMSNDDKWAAVTSELEWRTSTAEAGGFEPVTLEREIADVQLPPELINKSATIRPDDPLTGVGISHLREKGYLLTEADLISKHNSWLRVMAVWGRTPLREIEDQIALRKEEYHEAYLERLDWMSRHDHRMPNVYGRLFRINDPFDPDSLMIMSEYYKMRVEQNSIFTSFMYNDSIRVFKASDVHEFYNRDMESVRDRFAENAGSRYRPDSARALQLPDERRSHDRIESWLNSKPLERLFDGPLPPGVGPDDARIARDARSALENDWNAGFRGLLYLVITDDRKLVQGTQALLDSDLRILGSGDSRVVSLGVNDFVRFCMTKPQRKRANHGFEWIQGVIPNPYTEETVPVSGPLLDALVKEGRFLYRHDRKVLRIFYDYPNINRRLKRFWPEADYSGIREFSGGFLRRSTTQALGILPVLPLDLIYGLPDFTYGVKGFRGGFTMRATLRLYSARRGTELSSPWR